MPLFEYSAKNQSGATVQGTVDARTRDVALNLLRGQGLFVTAIRVKKESFLEFFLNLRGIPKNEVVNFTSQFSTMISAGLPISKGLEVLGNQITNRAFKKIIFDILRSIEGGASLSDAMGRYPNVFSATYQALVRAGESSGKLDVILKRLAETMDAERELNSKFKSAMIYPAIVFLAMIGVFIVLMVFVVPKLATMYRDMNVELPGVTQAMISVSDFMVENIILLLIGAFIGVIALRKYLLTEQGRYIVTELSFYLPIFGNINKQKEIAQLTRTLSLLIASAVPIVDSLNIVSNVLSSTKFKKAVLAGAKEVEKGNSLSSYFKSNPVFPPILSQMAAVGEETGHMDQMLEKISAYYDGEIDHLVKGLSAALEPVILVMLGIMVGFLIISIITPIYKLTSSI